MKRHSSFRGLRVVGGSVGIAIVILGALSMTSCDWLFGSGPKVYVSGYYGTGTSDSVACYWEGATRHDLPSGGLAAEAASIFLAGNSVYVAGSYKNASNIYFACGWKYGVRTDLAAPGTEFAKAAAIDFDGVTLRVAGFYAATDVTIPCYWFQGSVRDLPTVGGKAGFTTSIAVHSAG